MAKTEKATFKEIVKSIPTIANAYKDGLQAVVRKDAPRIKPQNPRK